MDNTMRMDYVNNESVEVSAFYQLLSLSLSQKEKKKKEKRYENPLKSILIFGDKTFFIR